MDIADILDLCMGKSGSQADKLSANCWFSPESLDLYRSSLLLLFLIVAWTASFVFARCLTLSGVLLYHFCDGLLSVHAHREGLMWLYEGFAFWPLGFLRCSAQNNAGASTSVLTCTSAAAESCWDLHSGTARSRRRHLIQSGGFCLQSLTDVTHLLADPRRCVRLVMAFSLSRRCCCCCSTCDSFFFPESATFPFSYSFRSPESGSELVFVLLSMPPFSFSWVRQRICFFFFEIIYCICSIQHFCLKRPTSFNAIMTIIGSRSPRKNSSRR